MTSAKQDTQHDDLETTDSPALERRKFFALSIAGLGAGASILLPGCSTEAKASSHDTGSAATDSGAGSTTDPLNTCGSAIPNGFVCDDESAAGLKHTPVIENFTATADSYEFDVPVPHAVTKAHHIIGCVIVAHSPAALPPHSFVDFFYYTNEYIRTAEDESWTHSFSVLMADVPADAGELQGFSVCNKHGYHGALTTLAAADGG